MGDFARELFRLNQPVTAEIIRSAVAGCFNWHLLWPGYIMSYFEYIDGVLHAEGVNLADLAAEVGTPAFVYSQKALEDEFKSFQEAFEGTGALICVSIKANSNRAVISTFANLGGGTDIVSGGELARALAAGVPPERIVYSGVGKQDWEIVAALEAGILMFNVESAQELDVLNEVAGKMGLKAPISIRVNPDVDAKTHPKITTGLAKNKFGMDMDLAFEQYQRAAKMPNLAVKGIDCHIGSQLTDVQPFADALERLAALVEKLAGVGIKLEMIDLGGGVGITYNEERPPTPGQYAAALKPLLAKTGLKPILEPGRRLVGNAGVLLTQVLYTKTTPAKHFVVVDAAMNDLMRPAFYDSYHGVLPLEQNLAQGCMVEADIVGGICESGDFLVKEREIPDFKRGDEMAFLSAGAYGFSMSSQYNSRPRAVEVMVNGDRWAIVRRRETIDDLSRGEQLAPWMV